MIDRRKVPTIAAPGTVSAAISDRDILLNFGEVLVKIFPNIIKIGANRGDDWDDILELNFCYFVYGSFQDKYDVETFGKSHKYGFTLHCYRFIHHIECRPLSYPVAVLRNGEPWQLTEDFVKDKILVFRAFASNEEDFSTTEVSRDIFEFEIADMATGFRFDALRGFKYSGRTELFDFEFVAEDYDEDEHRFFKRKFI